MPDRHGCKNIFAASPGGCTMTGMALHPSAAEELVTLRTRTARYIRDGA